MRVLLCVDDSAFSDAAVDYLAALPGADRMNVVVLSVARSSVILNAVTYTLDLGHDSDIMRTEIRTHERIADRAENRLRRVGVKAETRVECGDPRVEIVEAAARMEADLIVVGSHVPRWFRRHHRRKDRIVEAPDR